MFSCYATDSSCIDTREDLAGYRPSKYGNVVPGQLSSVLKSYGTQMSIQEPIYAALLHDMISVNLFHGEMPVGSITVVFIDRSRQPGDTALLLFIARRVEYLLKKHRLAQDSKKGVLEDIVQDLLS